MRIPIGGKGGLDTDKTSAADFDGPGVGGEGTGINY